MDTEEQSHLVQLTAVRRVTDSFRPSTPSSSPPSSIPLDLPRWTALGSTQAVSNDVNQILEIFRYFSNLATTNSLQNTVAARKLREAIAVLATVRRSTDAAKIPMSARTSYAETYLPVTQINNKILAITDIYQKVAELSRVAVYEVPVFSIWDSISLIYTLCVEEIHTNWRAELHLFQFRIIIRILSSHWYLKSKSPSTVAAAWSAGTSSAARSIAFATTCGDKGSNKTKNAEARFAFAKDLVRELNNLESIKGVLQAYNSGNCGDFPSVVLVCRLPGDYYSLCLNLEKNMIYKMCGYCEALVHALAEMSIKVKDLWLMTELGAGPGVEIMQTIGFSYRDLLTYDQVIRKARDLEAV